MLFGYCDMAGARTTHMQCFFFGIFGEPRNETTQNNNCFVLFCLVVAGETEMRKYSNRRPTIIIVYSCCSCAHCYFCRIIFFRSVTKFPAWICTKIRPPTRSTWPICALTRKSLCSLFPELLRPDARR